MTHWIDSFDERQTKEIEFSRVYANEYDHGTDGHNAKRIIAKLADTCDRLEGQLARYKEDEERRYGMEQKRSKL